MWIRCECCRDGLGLPADAGSRFLFSAMGGVVRASLYAKEGIRVEGEDSSRPNHRTIKFSCEISVIDEFLQKLREMG